MASVETPVEASLLAAARRVVEAHGWDGATLERVAAAAGVSRMTLHRRGIGRPALLAALREVLEREYREALWPVLSGPGSARERLERALEAECEVAEANLELLAALTGPARAAVFHEGKDEALTREVFVAPLERLLADGAADGSLKTLDPAEAATVLFNLVGFTYRHLRQGHGWPPKRARRAVLGVALEGVAA